MTGTIATASGGKQVERKLNVRRDTLDFRDRMFEATLIEVPTHIPLAAWRKLRVPLLDQGEEGACTGFGLATVANYLLLRRKVVPDNAPVSARMLYEMARRYDEWPGENYSGSSARGAMKGWHKHGVCQEDGWPYGLGPKDPKGLTQARTADAMRRPLGAYLRVNHRDLVAMHSALAEVGVLFASATVHQGWSQVDSKGAIPYPAPLSGGHAFAIVAYDSEGFWIQNSWGTGWGMGGFARISYDDWLANGTDVWVARLGAPVVLRLSESAAIAHSVGAGRSAAYSYSDLRPHVVSLGNDGALRPGGDFGTSPVELQQIFNDDMPRAMADWPEKHVLLYAHGGLVAERDAIQRLAEYRGAMLDAHIYPISFVWNSDYWSTITNVLQDAMRRRRPEGVLGAAKDFLLDRLDDTLEILARSLTGKASWDELKENALGATLDGGGALAAMDQLAALFKRMPFKLHVVGHSAGSIFHAPLVRLLTAPAGPIASGYLKGKTGYGIGLDTCTLWAPACTTELFKQAYLPAVRERSIGRFALFALDDKAEQDDNVAKIYNKSLLYMVSRAFEQSAFGPGTPILGMEKWLAADAELTALFTSGQADLVFSPNSNPEGSITASRSTEHGAFDDDGATVKATMARMLASGAAQPVAAPAPDLHFHHGSGSLRSRREQIDRQSAVRA
ncbi:C1 family peptidase [Caenimonas soli]|uniref:C1 family peptidase n=1 Tax=Caenimonas soli TaxID=2735555 RepID=UPI0015574CB0|nr:C1 family peptidase [Caenimonas soli]NPC55487.1 C1 family peptidase [Caenimonas soli]